MNIEFTAHNIRLDDGTFTKPSVGHSMERFPWFLSARRILDTVWPGKKDHLRIADLGCLEGGYAVEFARMGFQVLGIEVRDSNIAACNYVKTKTKLPNLEFAQDDVANIEKYGTFDAIFCCGLFYHLDKPRRFLDVLSSVTKKVLILQTHFSTGEINALTKLPRLARRIVAKLVTTNLQSDNFLLSEMSENEGIPGRWYMEFTSDDEFRKRETSKWASWDNQKSFWIQREYLLQAIQDVGFDMVLEQFDSLGPELANSMLRGYYKTQGRGTFVGIKTQLA